MEVNPEKIQSFTDSDAFYTWLSHHHETETELWMRIYKKASRVKSITWNEAVRVALCWGWIDGIKKSENADAYFQRFTPRKPKSVWSKRNIEHVAELIAEGKIQSPGQAHVDAAKADGRWDAAYSTSKEMQMPQDFLDALDKNPQAKAFYNTLNKQNRFAIYYRLQSAKREATRQKRFDAILKLMKQGKRLH